MFLKVIFFGFLCFPLLICGQIKIQFKPDSLNKFKLKAIEKNLLYNKDDKTKSEYKQVEDMQVMPDKSNLNPLERFQLMQAESVIISNSELANALIYPSPLEQKKERLFGPTPFDSRIELRQLNPLIPWQNDILRNASSIGMLIKKDALSKINDSVFRLSTESLKLKYNLCSGEAFADQPVAGLATVFVVGTQSVLTAAHAFDSPIDNYAVVFGFELVNKQGAFDGLIPASNVFYLTNVMKTDSQVDMCLLSLNRAAKRKPLEIEKSGVYKNSDEVYMIGHPSGLPMKVALNAEILKSSSDYVYTSLDAFQGNSGAPVFSRVTGKIIGVLVSGMNDFQWQGNCYISSTCKYPYCEGEKVLKSEALFALLE